MNETLSFHFPPKKRSKSKHIFQSPEEVSSLNTDLAGIFPVTEVCSKENSILAIDCEMVGIGDGNESMLARVSIVDFNGNVILDEYVKPRQEVVDYRTFVSGITPELLEKGKEFSDIQRIVADLIRDKILVGHALHNDLGVLFLKHPKWLIRDTAKFKKFRDMAGGRTPSLKYLAQTLMGRDIQSGSHSSIVDARTTMDIYKLYSWGWEQKMRRASFKRLYYPYGSSS